MASASASTPFPLRKHKEFEDLEESDMVWPDWTDEEQKARGLIGGSPQSWIVEAGQIAWWMSYRAYVPTKRARTVCLTMAYNLLRCQPYLYVRDFEGVPLHLQHDKEGLRQEVLRIQQDEEYMEVWNEWISQQSLRGCLPFDI